VYWVHITMFLGVFHIPSDMLGGIGNTNASVAGQDPIDKSHVASYVTSYFTARLAPGWLQVALWCWLRSAYLIIQKSSLSSRARGLG